jgi:NADH:ubiquinone oxidoreductase subunit 6 (subunit J)
VEGLLFHLVAAAGPAAARAASFSAAVIAAFVVYVGIAMVVVLGTDDVRKAEIRYRVFRDLLGLFRRGRR